MGHFPNVSRAVGGLYTAYIIILHVLLALITVIVWHGCWKVTSSVMKLHIKICTSTSMKCRNIL